MKYCPRCKRRLEPGADRCPECGGAPRGLGEPVEGAPPSSVGLDGTAGLTLQLAGMQHAVRRSQTALLATRTAAVLLAVLLIAVLTGWHFYRLLQYAEVSQVEVALVDQTTGDAQIKFRRINPGKVEFVREGGGRIETLIEHGDQSSERTGDEYSFSWSGPGAGDLSIRVRSRKGWSSQEQMWRIREGKLAPVD
ncbi:MAG: hypothetical protein ACKV0T_10510 [Planctomycetales bacterium]